MESSKNSRVTLIAFLLAVVVGLTALNIYQDKVIDKQRYELQWLIAHATINVEMPAQGKDAKSGPAPAGMKSDAKQDAVPAPAQAAAAVTPNAPTAKP
jgi:hypothetical protein